MTRFIELADRVFRVEVSPDAPGHRVRQLRLTVESGPALTVEEADRLSPAVVADLVAAGNDVIGWGYTLAEDAG